MANSREFLLVATKRKRERERFSNKCIELNEKKFSFPPHLSNSFPSLPPSLSSLLFPRLYLPGLIFYTIHIKSLLPSHPPSLLFPTLLSSSVPIQLPPSIPRSRPLPASPLLQSSFSLEKIDGWLRGAVRTTIYQLFHKRMVSSEARNILPSSEGQEGRRHRK